MDVSRLEGIGVFSGISKSELQTLAGLTFEVEVPEGATLATEGWFAHEFFVIEDGAAAVTQDGDEIALLGPGDFFGEIGLVATQRRTATVTAMSPMRLIVMSSSEFRQMAREMPAIRDRIESAIRARLS